MKYQADNNPSSEGRTVLDFPDGETLEDQAAQWVSKLDAQAPSVATVAAFKQWIKQSDEHRKVFEKHMALWNDMNVLTRMEPPAKAQLASPRVGLAHYWQQGLAVCLVLVLVLGLQWAGHSEDIYTTAIGEQKTVYLADGTAVLLNTNTQLQVAYSDQRRIIYLNYGEAHFNVAHNPDRPFEVFAGEGKVRAVGTAFTVYLKNDDVEVAVTEGVVEILPTRKQAVAAPNKLEQEPVLASAQRVEAGNVATYDRHTAEHVIQNALGGSEKLSWHKGVLVFKDEPLSRVIAEVNRYTAKKIVIPDKNIRLMKVSGFFKVSDIDAVFDALEQGFDIHAEVVSDELIYLVYHQQ